MSPETGHEYDAVFRRLDLFRTLVEHDILAERERAESLWTRLQALSPKERLRLVRSETRYQIWGLYGLILGESRKAAAVDPPAAAHLAELALAVADQLHSCAYGEPRIHDFRGAAWVALANARRLAADFAGCRNALQTAWEELDRGTEDPLEEAQLHSVHGSYLADTGEIEPAMAVLERARICARRAGDRHSEGRTLLQQASLLGENEPHRSVTLAHRALDLIDRTEDPHLELGAWHIFAFCLNAVGETREAEAILESHRSLYACYPDPMTTGRLHRLEAWIAREKGDLLKAEHCFRRQRAVFAKHGFDFDQVLAALELAEVLTLQTRFGEALEILTETYPLLEVWGLRIDVLRSWILLEEGVRARAAGSRAFRELAAMLRRRWSLH
jgi:tetratricopeptide (TPR) repeat protein